MNPHTGAITPINTELFLQNTQAELARAAKDVECAVEDLVLVAGKSEHIEVVSKAVKERNRTRNKQARKQRKVNRR